MKKFVSLALALVMICSMIPMASAAGNWGDGTTVTYVGEGTEAWTVTVPAEMAPGTTEQVAIEGTWAANRQLTISASETVTLVNDIKATDTKTLTVTFPQEVFVGDNNVVIEEEKDITVAAISDALFGEWSGTITYTVVMGDVVANG